MTPEERQKLLQAGFSATKITAFESARGGGVTPLGRGAETLQDISETASGLIADIERRADVTGEIGRKVEAGEISRPSGLLQRFGQGVGAAADVIGRTVIGAGKALLPQRTEEFIGEKVGGFVRGIAEKPLAQQIVNEFQRIKEDRPELIANVEALGNIGILAADLAGIGVGAKGAELAVTTGARGVTSASRATVEAGRRVAEGANIDNIVSQVNKLRTVDKANAVESLAEAYTKSFVDDSPAILNKLDAIGARTGRSADEVVRDASRFGYIPRIEGKLARFDESLAHIRQVQGELSELLKPRLAQIREITSLADLENTAKNILRSAAPGALLTRALSELERFMKSNVAKFGDTINATQLNQLRQESNQLTKAFRGEVFVQDAADAIADATRQRLDDIVPSGVVGELNAEVGKLFDTAKVIKLFNNKPIDVGVIGSQLGRYLGATALGASGIATGSGSLVVAGIAALWGGEAVANILRKLRFNPSIRDAIVEALKADQVVVRKLIEETQGADKAQLERLLLPEGAIPLGAKTVENVSKKKVDNVPRELELIASKAEIVPMENVITKFNRTGTADAITGKNYGIAIKDEGDFISVRFGPNKLTKFEDVESGKVLAGERNFGTKEEAFEFAASLQERIAKAKVPQVKGGIPKELEPLAKEARKFNTAEEFVFEITDSSLRGKGRLYDGVPATQRPITDFNLEKQEIGKVNRTQTKTSPNVVSLWKQRIEGGERPPIVVRKGLSESQEWIMDGHNKLKAYQELGFTEVPFITKAQLTDFFNQVKGK